MTAALLDPPLILDERPPDGPVCSVCGVDLVYKGTGRKPTKCDEHKGVKAAKSPAAEAKKAPGGNEKLALQATELLCQLNDLCGMGFMMAGLLETGSAWADRQDVFREQAYQALLADPALCKMILRAGATSGKVALMVAYGMLAAGVAPVAITELRAVRAARAENAEAA